MNTTSQASLPTRAAGRSTSKARQLTCFALILALPFLAGSMGNTWVRVLDFALLYALLALGLNLVVGYAGLLDLGYIAFYAVGAYTYAFLASPHFGVHLPFWLILPAGAILAALAGICLGFPTLRLRGDYLAIVTLGFGEIIRIFMNNLNQPINITNGPQGIDNIDPITLFGWDLSRPLSIGNFELSSVTQYYYLLLLLIASCIVLITRLQMSRIGRAWASIRDDELAAKAIGIDTRAMKLLAFAMGATFGGLSGGVFSAFQGFVSPESFSLMESIAVVTMIVLGGMGNIVGVIFGAIALTVLPEILRSLAVPVQTTLFGKVYLDPEILRMLLLSLGMILMMLLKPRGLVPLRAQYSRPKFVHTLTNRQDKWGAKA